MRKEVPIERSVPSNRPARLGAVITVFGLALLGATYVRALGFTPVERFQGLAQKIFYVHVPAAWLALVAFSVTGMLGMAYLVTKRRRLDLFAAASAEVGVALSLIVLTTGPLWSRPVWGTWWAWDARLVSMLALFLLFAVYLVLRRALRDRDLMREVTSVVGITGLVLVPFNHLAVALFRTVHPDPVVLRQGGPSIPPAMLATLMLGTVAYGVLYVGFSVQRYGLALEENGSGSGA